LRREIAAIDFLCSGTLATHTMMCGKPTCRCHTDPDARHGPYHIWGHMHDGKLVQRSVSAEQANTLRQAIANYRKVKKLLRAWETETQRLITAQSSR
jgi:hypothetical protein